MFDRVALIGQSFTRWPFTARVNVTIGRHERSADQQRLADAAGRYAELFALQASEYGVQADVR